MATEATPQFWLAGMPDMSRALLNICCGDRYLVLRSKIEGDRYGAKRQHGFPVTDPLIHYVRNNSIEIMF
jgi:hypothetical protein